jgi:hypothetical protein
MLDELQSWWQNITPQTQANLQTGGVVLGAALGGHVLGSMVARALRARNFDAVLSLPTSAPPPLEPDRGFTPTVVAGILVRLTVWAGTAWWLARQYGQAEWADTLGLIIKRTWALTTVVVTALALGTLVTRRLVDCLFGLPADRHGAAAPQRSVAGAVAAGVYGLTVLLVLLTAADLFDWPLTRSAVVALWQFAHHVLIAGAALLIGCLGARWARDLATADPGASPEKRAGQYTALGIMAATTVLAVAVLLSSAGVLVGVAALAVFGLLLWMVRGHLPDVMAGLQLRAHKVREVWFDGTPWQVTEVGLLTAQLCRAGEFCRVQNRVVLEARLQAAPGEAPR